MTTKLEAKAAAMIDEIAAILAADRDGTDPLPPAARARYEGAVTALEALLDRPPSLAPDLADLLPL